jgi:hypothetical protein
MGIILILVFIFFFILGFKEHLKYSKECNAYLQSLNKIYEQLNSSEKSFIQNKAIKTSLRIFLYMLLFVLLTIIISSVYYDWWDIWY